MIYIVYTEAFAHAGELVFAAFRRAFTGSQVRYLSPHESFPAMAKCLVFVNPDEECLAHFNTANSVVDGAKILILGDVTTVIPPPETILTSPWHQDGTAIAPAPANSFSDSNLHVHYVKSLGTQESPIKQRPFMHYDFRDEWNNLGFGAILQDDSIWALTNNVAVPEENRLAEVRCDNNVIATYAGLWDKERRSILWFNRAVGPIDSQEWRLVEHFFASYRHEALPCVPVLTEIPNGYDAAVTMRLDCDEDIESSRALFNSYQSWHVPFSLAIHTTLLADEKHWPILSEIPQSGGAILSHSDKHPVNWGGCYEAALDEAKTSAAKLTALLGAKTKINYAVSPFHHSPAYALQALSDAQYAGCIGGIICTDPEFFIARGGSIVGCHPDFVGHSQSCMLHGECLLAESDPLRIYKEAFLIAKRGRAFFGYLDHPFSERYSYGWESEAQRIEMHRQFIEFMRAEGKTLFLNENDALDFIRYKTQTELAITTDDQLQYHLPPHFTMRSDLTLVAEYKGRLISLIKEGACA